MAEENGEASRKRSRDELESDSGNVNGQDHGNYDSQKVFSTPAYMSRVLFGRRSWSCIAYDGS